VGVRASLPALSIASQVDGGEPSPPLRPRGVVERSQRAAPRVALRPAHVDYTPAPIMNRTRYPVPATPIPEMED